MTWEEAIRRAIKAYWKNTAEFDGLSTSKKEGRKYKKEYFDSVETEFLTKADKSEEKMKKGKY